MELTEFLRARLDERERFIRHFAQLLNEVHLQNADTPEHQHATVAFVFGQENLDPGFLLGEVEAKRRIVDDYRITRDACRRMTGPELDTPGYRAMCAGRDAFRSACASLAKAWSDHADYQEWA